MAATRPTAVNLFWAIERMGRVMEDYRRTFNPELKERLIEEAKIIHDDDIEINTDG